MTRPRNLVEPDDSLGIDGDELDVDGGAAQY